MGASGVRSYHIVSASEVRGGRSPLLDGVGEFDEEVRSIKMFEKMFNNHAVMHKSFSGRRQSTIVDAVDLQV